MQMAPLPFFAWAERPRAAAVDSAGDGRATPPGQHLNRSTPMCDYSLESLASRAANVGDQLVSTRFGESITRGFAAPGEPHVAVCLRPGTEVAFDREVEIENILGRGRESVNARVARFRQIDRETPHVHHDALEFPDGRIVLLTR